MSLDLITFIQLDMNSICGVMVSVLAVLVSKSKDWLA